MLLLSHTHLSGWGQSQDGTGIYLGGVKVKMELALSGWHQSQDGTGIILELEDSSSEVVEAVRVN